MQFVAGAEELIINSKRIGHAIYTAFDGSHTIGIVSRALIWRIEIEMHILPFTFRPSFSELLNSCFH